MPRQLSPACTSDERQVSGSLVDTPNDGSGSDAAGRAGGERSFERVSWRLAIGLSGACAAARAIYPRLGDVNGRDDDPLIARHDGRVGDAEPLGHFLRRSALAQLPQRKRVTKSKAPALGVFEAGG